MMAHSEPHVTLQNICENAWYQLAAGAGDPLHPFHTAVLSTVNAQGLPDARTVVVRHVERNARTISCHTDKRSPKASHLQATPWASWVLYDPVERTQIRIAGPTHIDSPDSCEETERAWQQTPPASRRPYLGPMPPSSVSAQPTSNLPEHLVDRVPTELESKPGRANFRRLVTVIHSLDWLKLRDHGNLRARWQWDDHGNRNDQWLEP